MQGRRIAVVMAGGSGERFWPLSTPGRPKQLLNLTDPDQTMLEEAVRRIEPVVGAGNVLVSTGRALAGPIADAGVVPPDRILAEPAKRNTLGALAWVAADLIAKSPGSWRDISLAVVTADHKIGEPELFRQTVTAALTVAEKTGALVTVGVRPTRAETGFGYIEADWEQPLHGTEVPTYLARSFREKPTPERAEHYWHSGSFLWNSGMFFWTLGAFADQMAHAQPEAMSTIREMSEAMAHGDSTKAESLFAELPNISIDYALLEKATHVFVVEGSFPWDDVGSWDALSRTLQGDEQGNILQGEVVCVDAEKCIVVNGTPGVDVALVGVHNLVVVTTPNAVLVCAKDRAQDVKKILEKLQRGEPAP